MIDAGIHFYPRPPRGGRRTDPHRRASHARISIHVLREEDDQIVEGLFDRVVYFYPRPPRGGRPAEVVDSGETGSGFLSTSSARRTTNFLQLSCAMIAISIHVLREEDDL